jgi:hypothetical protein
MDNSGTTTATLDQADEEVLTYTVSDEALEAAAPRIVATARCSTSDTACLSCYPDCKAIFPAPSPSILFRTR